MREEKVVAELDDLDALIIEKPVDLFYLTGIHLSAGTLIIGKEISRLFVDGRYIEQCESRSPITAARFTDSAVQDFLKKFKKVGFDSAVMPYERYHHFSQMDIELIQKPHFMRWIRAVKEPEEINALRKAGALAAHGYRHIRSRLREGVTEIELARELEIFWLQEGGEKLSFEPIISFGAHTAMPHYQPAKRHLKEGMAVLFDIGVQSHNYQSDLTRVDLFGTPDPKLQEIYEIVREAKAAATDLVRHGVPTEDVDRVARSVIEDAGYGPQFLHGLGHGVGLEIHEFPRLRPTGSDGLLKANMVVTIEPGIYLPGIGGIRLEDTILITETGYESLTA